MSKPVNIQFTAIKRADKCAWIEAFSRPHILEWWGSPEAEWGLLDEALDTGEAYPFWASMDDNRLAYVQYWSVALARGMVDPCEDIWLATLSDDTIGVDISLLNGEDVGKGLGRKILRAFAAKLLSEGFKNLVIDPDIKNLRAIKCYMAAGFVRVGQYPERNGGTLLMRWADSPARVS